MKYEILDFIKRRFSHDENWINGNCLWFAFILKKRFPKAKIYYLPIQGHFVTLIDGEYYDWTGVVELEEQPYALNWIKRVDKLLYKRLIRDCME